MGCITIIW